MGAKHLWRAFVASRLSSCSLPLALSFPAPNSCTSQSSFFTTMAALRNDKKPYSVCFSCFYLVSFGSHLPFAPQRPPARPRASEGAWLHDKASGFKKNQQNASRPARATAASDGNTKLVVSNLHYELTPKDLTVRSFSYLIAPQMLTFAHHRTSSPFSDNMARSCVNH